MKKWKTRRVEVKRQIESVVEEKEWIGDQQLNQESSKGGERFRKSPIIFTKDVQKHQKSAFNTFRNLSPEFRGL